MTTVALLSATDDLGFLRPLLLASDPGLDVAVWPDPRCLDAEVVVGWNSPAGIYAKMPRLKLVHSIAAGVDNVVAGQDVSAIPVCRVVDPSLAETMFQFVLWSVLYFHRRFDDAQVGQKSRKWRRPAQTPASDCRVGFMGMGELGRHAAAGLARLGYSVSGWARTPHDLDGVAAFSGNNEFEDFLRRTDVLVCLLPLTESTRGILNERTFAALPQGSALVHCGRGEHLIEDDLRDAIAAGRLRGAVIDVFRGEPLPPEHPLWTTPGVVVTPHMAATTDINIVVHQVVRNLQCLREGTSLNNCIDPRQGY